MKRFTYWFTAAAFVAGLGIVPAVAQVTTNIKVDIPFDFTVGDRTLPPGQYSVKGSMGSSFMIIQGMQEKHNIASALTSSAEKLKASNASKLVFHKTGDRYFLRSAWTAGASAGRELVKSKMEREAERAGLQTETLVVLALNTQR